MLKDLVQCALKTSPIISNEESIESTIDDDDELPFGLVDTIKKKFHKIVNRIRCAVGVIGEVIGDGELKNVFEDFKHNVTQLLNTDVRQCAKTKGLTGKLK